MQAMRSAVPVNACAMYFINGLKRTGLCEKHRFLQPDYVKNKGFYVMQAMRSAVPVNACAMYFINGLKRTGLCEKHRFLQPDYVKNKGFYSRIM